MPDDAAFRALVDSNERLAKEVGLLEQELLKWKGRAEAAELTLRARDELIKAQSVGYDLVQAQLASLRVECDEKNLKLRAFREYLHRIRNNPLASFFVSSHLCEKIDQELKHERPVED